MATKVSHKRLTPLRLTHYRPEEPVLCIIFHCITPRLTRAATAGGEQVEGHDDAEEQLPAQVPRSMVTMRAGVMFSGKTGAVVASGEGAATSAPSLQLAKVDATHAVLSISFSASYASHSIGITDAPHSEGVGTCATTPPIILFR